MSSFCICKSYSHFFSKNNCALDIVLTRTVNILATNVLVKLMMLEQLGSEYCSYLELCIRGVARNFIKTASAYRISEISAKARHLLHVLIVCVPSKDSDQPGQACAFAQADLSHCLADVWSCRK